MSDYLDLATDLINASKIETDVGKQQVILHQLREILLVRDKTCIPLILKDMMDLAIGSNTHKVIFLIRFAGEILKEDINQLPIVIASFNFIMTMENDKIHQEVAIVMKNNYSKMVMAIAELISININNDNETSIKLTWKQFRSVSTKIVDKISSNRASEQLRTDGIILAEGMILFGLPAPQQKVDPRRRRAVGISSTESSSIANITSTNPFIVEVKGELEREAEDVFSKLLLWAQKGGPQGSPFTSVQLSLLGQGIAGIAGQRHARVDGADAENPRSTKATKALNIMLKSKNTSKNMLGTNRKTLVATIHRFLLTSPPDPTNDIPKLKESLKEWEAKGFEDDEKTSAAAAAAAAAPSRKRGRSSSMDVSEEYKDLSKEEIETMKQQAIQALDESEKALKRVKIEQAAIAASAPSVSGASLAETELSSDLAPEFTDGTSTLSEVSGHKAASRGSGMVYSLVPLEVSMDQIGTLAASTLQRLLDSFYTLKAEGMKALAAHARMTVRTVIAQCNITMNLTEIKGESNIYTNINVFKVPIFSLIPEEVDQKLLVGIPQHVLLPRPIYQLLSFVLRPSKELDISTNLHVKQAYLLQSVREKLDMLVLLLKELLLESQPDEQGGQGNETAKSLYDSLALVILSRLLQNLHLREIARPLYSAMPRVPIECINLLKLLMHAGTKPKDAVITSSSNRQTKEQRQRGTRQEAMSLLGGLVACVDENAGRASLNHLLWCAVSDDFEIRGRAVALLVNEVMHENDWAYEQITLFALQSAAQLVSIQSFLVRADAVYSSRALNWGALAAANEAKAKAEAADEKDMDIESPEENVDGEEEQTEETPEVLSVVSALEGYDDGFYFNGSFTGALPFPTLSDSTSSTLTLTVVGPFAVRCTQLLTQICSLEPSLLGAFIDIFAAVAIEAGLETSEDVALAATEAVMNSKREKPPADAEIDTAATPVVSISLARAKFDAVLLALRKNLVNILPGVLVNHPTEKIFEALARSDVLGRPLLSYSMEVLHSDILVPSTPECIKSVVGYLQATTSDSGTDAVASDTTIETEIATAATDNAHDNEQFLIKLSDTDLRFCLPLLGGFKRATVENAIPKILRMLLSTPDVLNRALSRIVSVRPAVMTKAEFLTLAHRVDKIVNSGIDRTLQKDIIALCLEREDFDGTVINEALFHLEKDEKPCYFLMRTGILSAKKYKDVRKYLLSETVPKLIRKRVWAIRDEITNKLPVWEGVVQCVKMYADGKDVEQMNRCVLALDGPRLGMVLKIAPKVKPILAKLLKTLSTKEKEEVVTGRWAGIEHEKGKVDSEKKRIIEELQNMKL